MTSVPPISRVVPTSTIPGFTFSHPGSQVFTQSSSTSAPSFAAPVLPPIALSQAGNKSRKRKGNQNTATKSPEQSEIEFLKLQLNAIRTHVIEIETTRDDLEKRNKILADVIKMHEKTQTAHAYTSLFPESMPPASSPRITTCSTNPCHSSRVPPCSHSSMVTPHHCCCMATPHYCTRSSEKGNYSLEKSVEQLKASVESMQCDIIDVIEQLEKIKSEAKPTQSPAAASLSPAPARPQFKNPRDIPDYDSIEVVTEAEIHQNALDDSIVSMDEFVPEITSAPQDPLN